MLNLRKYLAYGGGSVVTAVGLGLLPLEANAVSLRIDTNPSATGVQTIRKVVVGENFSIDVLIQDASGVTGFATEGGGSAGSIGDGQPLPLLFDGSALAGQSVSAASFLPGPFSVENEGFSGGEVYFNREPDPLFFGDLPDSSSGVLFSVTFEALVPTSSFLTFASSGTIDIVDGQDDVVLHVPAGQISSTVVIDATASTAAVPAPSAFGLLSLALAACGVLRLRKHGWS